MPVVGRPARHPPGRVGVGWPGAPRLLYSSAAVSSEEIFRLWARRGCREALAGGGFPHLHQRRIVACWHIATCHHAAEGSTLRGPRLLGCGPALTLSVVTHARRRQLRRVERGLEDGGGGYWGGLVRCGPPYRRRRRIGLGYLQPCAASGRRRWRRERRLLPWAAGIGTQTEAGREWMEV
jgi:hypothetical protein